MDRRARKRATIGLLKKEHQDLVKKIIKEAIIQG